MFILNIIFHRWKNSIDGEFTKKIPELLELINKFIRIIGYMINTQKSFVFLCTFHEQSENNSIYKSIKNT